MVSSSSFIVLLLVQLSELIEKPRNFGNLTSQSRVLGRKVKLEVYKGWGCHEGRVLPRLL